MASEKKWYFTQEELCDSPSNKSGISTAEEKSCRYHVARLIMEMGQKLHLSQLVINTAVVYVQRFYVFHSLSHFTKNHICCAALFLAAKVEEQPRKLQHVIKVAHLCNSHSNIDIESKVYEDEASLIIYYENILLMTLGFDLQIEHPHSYIVKYFQLMKNKPVYNKLRASQDIAKKAYHLATNSLKMTTLCLQYEPSLVACMCIYMAGKNASCSDEINLFLESFNLIDNTISIAKIEQLASEFRTIQEQYIGSTKRLTKGSCSSVNSSKSDSSDFASESSLSSSSFSSLDIRCTSSDSDLFSPPKAVLCKPPASKKVVLTPKQYIERRETVANEADPPTSDRKIFEWNSPQLFDDLMKHRTADDSKILKDNSKTELNNNNTSSLSEEENENIVVGSIHFNDCVKESAVELSKQEASLERSKSCLNNDKSLTENCQEAKSTVTFFSSSELIKISNSKNVPRLSDLSAKAMQNTQILKIITAKSESKNELKCSAADDSLSKGSVQISLDRDGSKMEKEPASFLQKSPLETSGECKNSQAKSSKKYLPGDTIPKCEMPKTCDSNSLSSISSQSVYQGSSLPASGEVKTKGHKSCKHKGKKKKKKKKRIKESKSRDSNTKRKKHKLKKHKKHKGKDSVTREEQGALDQDSDPEGPQSLTSHMPSIRGKSFFVTHPTLNSSPAFNLAMAKAHWKRIPRKRSHHSNSEGDNLFPIKRICVYPSNSNNNNETTFFNKQSLGKESHSDSSVNTLGK